MSYADVFERSPIRAFERSLHGGLTAGQLGAVVGRAGVGKSSLLVHLALDRLLRDERVLHVSLREDAQQVRAFYTEIFDAVSRVARLTGREKDQTHVRLEQARQIQCFLERRFTSEDLGKALAYSKEFMQFVPSLVVVDGMDVNDTAELAALRELARASSFAVWAGVRSHRELAADPSANGWDTVVELEPVDTIIELRARKVHGEVVSEGLGLQLEPTTMLISGEDTWDPLSSPPSPRPEECTLYSGGAVGAEAAFGANAERYGVSEVNFTFDGHRQARTQGSRALSERELAAGDVSLVYVSKRLHRTYSEGSMIRKVLQSLWHQVSRAQQVFVVGAIQDDGTVTGGTGWSVELARMWHKNLWVYDQVEEAWFHWTGERFVKGVPVIENPHFCGTGTRKLKPNAEAAIEALFDRSFGLGF